MGFELTCADYIEWIGRAHAKIAKNADYITELDAATGDGDHWTNINMGFEKLVEMSDELAALSIGAALKRIGMTMMSVVGGSGGVLYGSAYMEAAKAVEQAQTLTSQDVCNMLEAMLGAIMSRGKAQPGDKTMIDTLHPAVQCYKNCLEQGEDEAQTLALVKQAALDGAQATKDMEAARGRAYYQAGKGVGHLDPGAVTMSYQIETLMDYIGEKL